MTQEELERLRRKAENLSTLIEVSTIINSTLDLEQVIRLVMVKAQEVMNAEASSVFLINPKTQKLEVHTALGKSGGDLEDRTQLMREKITLDMGQGIAGWVAQHGELLNIPDAHKDPRFYRDADRKTGFRTRSILAAPLRARERIIGVAEVMNRRDGQPFSEEDAELFNTFCQSVALAIENARLHKEALEQERIRQQLQSAKIIQQSFLPQTFPSCPYNRFQLWASYHPAKVIGGDFYDFIPLSDDEIGIVIGDVSGKGIPAALFMARLLSDFHFLALATGTPERTIEQLNRSLVNRQQQGMFVTLIYGIYNAATGRFRYVNAGHLPFLVIRGKKRETQVYGQAATFPLGIRAEMEMVPGEVTLGPQDVLFLFTDGLIETEAFTSYEQVIDRLAAFLAQPWETPKALIEHLEQNWLGHKVQSDRDDLSMIALKHC